SRGILVTLIDLAETYGCARITLRGKNVRQRSTSMDSTSSGGSVVCWVGGTSTVCVVFCFFAFCVVNGEDERS
ncbi:16499_t:CDS:2, partial [Funneliformis geosporum]